jgi:YesN/AraC family two-component response regulator
MLAQNYNYIITLMLEKGQPDSIQYYCQLIEDLVPRIDLAKFEKNKSDSLKAHHEIAKIRAVSTLSLAHYYQLTGSSGKADSCYRKVLGMAKMYGFESLGAKAFFKMGTMWANQGQVVIALQFVDSALQCYLKRNDFESVIETANFLSGLNSRIDSASRAIGYQNLSSAYSDSLRYREMSAKVLNDKLFLAAANTKLAIKDLRYRQVMATKIIKQQKMLIGLLLLIGLMAILVVVFIRIFRKRLKRTNLNLARRTMEVMANETIMRDYQRASVQKPLVDNLVTQSDQLLQSEKVYLDSNLTLASLAEKLGTNTTYLSRIFNEQHKMGFNDYINELRVKESCRLILATNDKNVTIDQILCNSGFGSRTSFYSAFKKFTGVTPDVFKRMNQSPNEPVPGL